MQIYFEFQISCNGPEPASCSAYVVPHSGNRAGELGKGWMVKEVTLLIIKPCLKTQSKIVV